jgi:hypothetical protein
MSDRGREHEWKKERSAAVQDHRWIVEAWTALRKPEGACL